MCLGREAGVKGVEEPAIQIQTRNFNSKRLAEGSSECGCSGNRGRYDLFRGVHSGHSPVPL